MADSPPTTPAELIDRFGGNVKFARVIGKAPSTAGEQKRNGSIPVEYWDAIIAAAPSHGIDGVTWELLGKMHTPASRKVDAEART